MFNMIMMRKVTGDESIRDLISRGHALCPFRLNINNLTKLSEDVII